MRAGTGNMKDYRFSLETLDLAHHLIGATLHQGDISLSITEVEAYRSNGDTASHARFGLTDRNQTMFGPSGHAYVYLCYGIHWMLNVTAGPEGEGAAVLIRSAEVLTGGELVAERRQSRLPWRELNEKTQAQLTAGPGKVGQALSLTRRVDGKALYEGGELFLRFPEVLATTIRIGPRVGIDFAQNQHVNAPWRLAHAHSHCVTVPKRLRTIHLGSDEWYAWRSS